MGNRKQETRDKRYGIRKTGEGGLEIRDMGYGRQGRVDGGIYLFFSFYLIKSN